VGLKAKDSPFYGYKIHSIADFKAGLPINVAVTPTNQHENSAFKPLVKAARKRGLKASRICGDAIHDSKATRRFVKDLEAKAFIDQNPRRGGGTKKKPASKTYRRLKASAERVFSRAKELNLEGLKVRGLKSITIWVYQVFTAILAITTATKGNDLDNHTRCIRSIFG